MSQAYLVRIILTGLIDGATALPANALVTPDPANDELVISGPLGARIVGNVGRFALGPLLEGYLGSASFLVTSCVLVSPGATAAAAASGPRGGTQRWSPVRAFNPNAASNAFCPNTIPILGNGDVLIVSSNGGAGNQDILLQVVPAPPKEVMAMCAAGFLFAPDTGNVVQIQTTDFLPFTSESAPIAAAQALAMDMINIYDTAAGAFGVTVPAAQDGQWFGVKNVPGGSANALTITPAAGQIENIAGALGANAAIASATAALLYQGTDAGNWLLASRS